MCLIKFELSKKFLAIKLSKLFFLQLLSEIIVRLFFFSSCLCLEITTEKLKITLNSYSFTLEMTLTLNFFVKYILNIMRL